VWGGKVESSTESHISPKLALSWLSSLVRTPHRKLLCSFLFDEYRKLAAENFCASNWGNFNLQLPDLHWQSGAEKLSTLSLWSTSRNGPRISVVLNGSWLSY